MTEKKKIKVALLEDSELVAELVKTLLEELGFEVFHSESASKEWLDKLEQEGVEHFLLDVEQEGKPLGLQFAREVKEKIKNSKIIMMSGNPEHERKALEEGHNFLEKPFTFDSFKHSIKKHFKL